MIINYLKYSKALDISIFKTLLRHLLGREGVYAPACLSKRMLIWACGHAWAWIPLNGKHTNVRKYCKIGCKKLLLKQLFPRMNTLNVNVPKTLAHPLVLFMGRYVKLYFYFFYKILDYEMASTQ